MVNLITVKIAIHCDTCTVDKGLHSYNKMPGFCNGTRRTECPSKNEEKMRHTLAREAAKRPTATWKELQEFLASNSIFVCYGGEVQDLKLLFAKEKKFNFRNFFNEDNPTKSPNSMHKMFYDLTNPNLATFPVLVFAPIIFHAKTTLQFTK